VPGPMPSARVIPVPNAGAAQAIGAGEAGREESAVTRTVCCRKEHHYGHAAAPVTGTPTRRPVQHRGLEPAAVITTDDTRRTHQRDKLTIAEICADLGISRRTFYEWRAKNRAPKCIALPNGSLRIRRSEYQRWLSAHEEAA